MHDIRTVVHFVLLMAAAVLLAGSACLPPVAWHDGLPAWSPPAGKPEASIGYHRMFWSEVEGSAWYVTPGLRVGLARPPTAVDIGLVSMMAFDGGDFGLLVGPAFGIGRSDDEMSAMFRASIYFGAGSGFWPQASVLVGNGYRARGVNLAVGGRASMLGTGPVAVAGANLGGVELRGELSYMLSMPGSWATGRALTVGLTVAAPTGPGPTDK